MAGTWRALLVGSQTGGLEGVEGDVEKMAAALAQQGFADLRRCTGPDASRDGILGAYDRLIDDARRDDTVCFYYSGHGNRAPNPSYRPGNGTPPALQYLIPTDDGPAAFRGILSFELSRYLARLTEQTRNVVVILDCCHSALMSRAARDKGLRPKAAPSRVGDAALGTLLKATSAADALLNVESNPYAVRLVATEAQSIAYERIDESGQPVGAFTEALRQALSELPPGREVSWNAVMLRVREMVMSRIPDQRPGVEGPGRRRVWAVDEARDERPLALFFDGSPAAFGGEAKLRGGRLLGVVPGATYGVMPAGSDLYAGERSLGTAVVEDVAGSVARVHLEARPGAAAGAVPVGAGLPAFPLSVPFAKCRVAVGGADVPAALSARLAASRYLTKGGLPGDEQAPSVTADGGALVVRDPAGDVLLEVPLADAATGLDGVIDCLERVARAEDLRRMDPGQLDATLDIAVGRVVNGQRVPMEEGETVHVGDRQFLSVENAGFEPVYVAVLGIDAAHECQLLLRRAPRGQRLAPREGLIVGENASGALLGVELSWLDGIPRDRPRRESLIVIAAEEEQDFMLLTTGSGTRGGARSALEQRLEQIRAGTERSRGTRGDAGTGGTEYLLRRIDYQLDPERRS